MPMTIAVVMVVVVVVASDLLLLLVIAWVAPLLIVRVHGSAEVADADRHKEQAQQQHLRTQQQALESARACSHRSLHPPRT